MEKGEWKRFLNIKVVRKYVIKGIGVQVFFVTKFNIDSYMNALSTN